MKHKIGWLNRPGTTGETWNPIIGCSKCSPGCANCYAERMACRQAHMREGCEYCDVTNGEWHEDGMWKAPTGWNGLTAFVPSQINKPLRWRKPRTVFVVSMGDLFHHSVPFEWQLEVWSKMAACPQHTFILLTKRAAIMADRVGRIANGPFGVLPNVWIGVTICTRIERHKRDYLRDTPVAVRFVSFEPLLDNMGNIASYLNWIDWVIVGGESGPGSRAMNPWRPRSIRDQCADAGVPFFFKQWGDACAEGAYDAGYCTLPHGGDGLDGRQWHEWPGETYKD